jgi:phosphate uptake regulator
MKTQEQSITQQAEKGLRRSLQKQIKLTSKSFDKLIDFLNSHNYKDIEKIYSISKQFDLLNSVSINTALSNFMKAPLGKDLRRNVAYTMIARDIKDIQINAENIASFVTNIQGYSIDKT